MLHIDFETRSAVDLPSAGSDVYARHPSTDVWCMAYAFDDEDVEIWKMGEPPPLDVFLWVMEGKQVIAHNYAFEHALWNCCMAVKHGWPPLTMEQGYCTQTYAYAMALPAKLEKLALALGLGFQKDMTGSRVMMQLSQPRRIEDGGTVVWWMPEENPEKFWKLYEYCKQDVRVEREAAKKLFPLSKDEREIWLLDQRINRRGIQVDINSAKKAIEVINLEKEKLDAEMRDLTGGIVEGCTKVTQLTAWIRGLGYEIEGVAKGDVVELLERGDLSPRVLRALALRQEAAKSSTAKLESMVTGTCPDGRMRGIFQYHGAGTGRWAGRRVQPQNFPRPKLSQVDIDQVFTLLGSQI